MTSQQFLVCDNSTLANFKQWAQAISGFFTTIGWTQSSDTGQVNWSTISTVPGSGAYVYEVWKPGDALTPYFLKIEYGNTAAVNSPAVRLSVGQTTNGAGTLTGFFIGPNGTNTASYTTPSTTTQYECNFSGDSGRIGVMLWRNAGGNCPQFFAIERSLNSSGTYTGAYVTIYTVGNCSGGNSTQQTLLFNVGGTQFNGHGGSGGTSGWALRYALPNSAAGAAFNGSIPMDLVTPSIGYFDYPCTVAGGGNYGDFAEGVTFTVTVYGATRTYMAAKAYPFGQIGIQNATNWTALLMRFD